MIHMFMIGFVGGWYQLASLSLIKVAYGRLKTKECFNLLALKVVIVALQEVPKYSNYMTGKLLVILFCKTGCWGELVTYERKSQPEIQLQFNNVTIVIEIMSLCSSANRVDVLGCSGSMLIQAIRSHIYFSQLSAWLSRSKGSVPSQVIYRSVLNSDQSDTTTVSLYLTLPICMEKKHFLWRELTFPLEIFRKKKTME